jgi:hypothetical protein
MTETVTGFLRLFVPNKVNSECKRRRRRRRRIYIYIVQNVGLQTLEHAVTRY